MTSIRSTHALTKRTTLSEADVFRMDLDPSNAAVAETQRAITGGDLLGTSKTEAEDKAGVTVTDIRLPPGNVKRYGAVADSATDDSAAFQSAIDQAFESNGAEIYVPAGNYYIDTQINVLGSDMKISGTYASVLQWNGSTSENLFKFGNAGTTLTRGNIVTALSIQDETTGSTLFQLDKADRCDFSNLRFFALSLLSVGAGINIKDSTLIPWDNLRFKFLNKGIEVGVEVLNGTAANNLTNGRFETLNTAGVHWPVNSTSFSFSIDKCTFQGGFFTGILVEQPQSALSITRNYFEDQSWAIDFNHPSVTQEYIAKVESNFFSDSSQDAHIRHNGSGLTLMTEANLFRDDPLVRLIKDTGKYLSLGNESVGGDPGTTNEVYKGAITGATQANPCVITDTAHGYTTADEILLDDIVDDGPGGDFEALLNDIVHTITVLTADTYELDGIDTSATTNVYASAGQSEYNTPRSHRLRVTGDGYLALEGSNGLKHDKHYIPNCLTGTASGITTGSSQAVTFATPFKRVPTVMAITSNNNAGEVSIASSPAVTVSGFTVFNHAAGTRDVAWIAFEAS